MKETDLYGPVKAFLESSGYVVKGEIGPADVMARRGDEPPLIVELKTRFSLALFHQAIDRLRLTDAVYVAVPRAPGRAFAKSLKANVGLARRLGLGLITVRPKDGLVEVHADPGPYAPRANTRLRKNLLREFQARTGDPTLGGTRGRVMTAYRQDALACLDHLCRNGPSKGAVVAAAVGVPRATRLMADNHYGWFERIERGVYGATESARTAWSDVGAGRGSA